jgi:hypothetical protein
MGRTVFLGLLYRRIARRAVARGLCAIVDRHDRARADQPSVGAGHHRTYNLDGMVFELLGFDSRMNKLGQNPAFAPAFAGMECVFARAAQRWFGMP